MGQTLTHGIYLPDEGERNCYSGLAANWQILDTSVGTIAAHTAALSGKAPLVHTHTKADITDLFNSANVWSGDQNFRKTLLIQNSVAVSAGSYDIGINFFDSVGNRYGYIQPYITSNNQKRLMFGSDTGELSCNSDLIPANNNLNFGNSALKWKSLNGTNPGALSLPNFDSDGYVDLSSNLTENVQYTYTPTVDGWLALYAQVNGFHAENAVGIFNADSTLGNNSFRWANTATAAINLARQTGKYYGSIFLPVRAGYSYFCWLKVDQSTTLGQKWLIFYKAKGNV